MSLLMFLTCIACVLLASSISISEDCEDAPICSVCKAGWWGDACKDPCSKNCTLQKCDKVTGMCFTCQDDRFFGETCENQCPTNCLGGNCNRNTGYCFQCNGAYFGSHCNYKCSQNCAGGVCDIVTGQCYSCRRSMYYGKLCEDPCPKSCLNGLCEPDSTCIACKKGTWGMTCENSCRNCDVCNRKNGDCQVG